MPGSEPYMKPCNNCAKQIILGIDPTTNKWRPWDNYATREKHNCKSLTQAQEVAAIATGSTTDQNWVDGMQNSLAGVQKQVAQIENNISMLTWMTEKIAKKLGVDDLEQE